MAKVRQDKIRQRKVEQGKGIKSLESSAKRQETRGKWHELIGKGR